MNFVRKIFGKKDSENAPGKQQDVNIAYGNTGSTSLVDAARAGEFDTVSKLLQKGYNVDVRDEFGSTALIYAVAAHKEEVVKVLLDFGADVNLVDDGWSDSVVLLGFLGLSGLNRETAYRAWRECGY